MKILALAALFLLAGCTDAGDVDKATPALDKIPPTSTPPLVVTFDPLPDPAPERLVLTGTVTSGAVVSIAVLDGDVVVAGGDATIDGDAWSFEIDVPVGQSIVEATADDGVGTASANVTLRRLAKMAFEANFRGDIPARADRADAVMVDSDDFSSLPMYEGCAVGHPGHFTVHDALVQWSAATDVTISYGACGPFGHGVDAIDGYENPGDWCYLIDGEAAEFGISTQAVAPGQTVTWDDCFVRGIG